MYAHFYAATLASSGQELTTPIRLQQDIRKLINIRRQQLEGDMTILSESGSPSGDTANVFVARRRGNATLDRPSGILGINNYETETKCMPVDNTPARSSYTNWSNKTLVDLTGAEPSTQVSSNGRVSVCAPPRGYSIYVPIEWMNNRASDFDRDGKAELAVWRPSTGLLYFGNSAVRWGLPGDKVLSADYDGDRKADIAVWRPSNGTWYILCSSDDYDPARAIIVKWGIQDDIPVPADYDGDGRSDIAVFRPSTGDWYIFDIVDGSFKIINFGIGEDLPVPADYDGDGRSDIAVWRPSTGVWHILNSGIAGYVAYRFGLPGDQPVPADFDGDRKVDSAIYRPDTGDWYVLNSGDMTVTQMHFGISRDIPTPSDFDGDGNADIAVWRPSTGVWYVSPSTGGFYASVFGTAGDVPLRSASIP